MIVRTIIEVISNQTGMSTGALHLSGGVGKLSKVSPTHGMRRTTGAAMTVLVMTVDALAGYSLSRP
jgi:hypothetical protein